jgi:hypothetical protein
MNDINSRGFVSFNSRGKRFISDIGVHLFSLGSEKAGRCAFI